MEDHADRLTVRCPGCRAPVTRASADFPFCSRRCRIIDLGRWASEEYRIPGEPADLGSGNPDAD